MRIGWLSRVGLCLAVALMPATLVARPRAATAPRPRALTMAELSERKLLGPFDGMDPDRFENIWHLGRDPRTCFDAQQFALIYRGGLDRLKREIDFQSARTGPMADQIVELELRTIDLLEFMGRYGAAERYLNQRLAISRARDNTEAVRAAALRVRLGLLYAETRPVEGEQIIQAVVRPRVAEIVRTQEAQAHGYPAGGDVVRRARLDAELMSADYAQQTLAPFYLRAGRPQDALRLYRAAAGPWENGAPSDPFVAQRGAVPDIEAIRANIAKTRADMAAASGTAADADPLYLACCQVTPEYARLLLGKGRVEEARVVLARMMFKISVDLEDSRRFQCMKTAAGDSSPSSIQHATTIAAERLAESARSNLSQEIDDLIGAAADLRRATELGELLIQAGLVDDARDVLSATYRLQATVFGDNHPDSIRTLAALARAVRLQGRPADAVALWAQWQALGGSFLLDRLWSVSEDDRRSFFRNDHRNVSAYLAALREAAPVDAAAQVLALTLGHKGMLAGVAADITARAQSRGDPQVTALVGQLRRQRGAFAALALHGKGEGAQARLTRRRIDELEADLAATMGGGADPGRAAGVQALLAALKPGDALVDFMVFTDSDASGAPAGGRMVAVVAKAGVAPQLVWWEDFAPVRAAAARFRRAILSDDGEARRAPELAAAGRTLNALLWDPIAARLNGATRIFLGPDEVLDVVPLAAMPDAQGRALIQRYPVAALSAPRDLLAAAAPARSSGPALVIGNPAFGAARGVGGGINRVIAQRGGDVVFGPLPGTASESRGVDAILAGRYASRLLDGATATKGAVLAVRSPAILHLATHGFFLTGGSDDPLVSLSRSGIALANANVGIRANDPGDTADGILTALDAASLDLSGTKLVVLSACETALGEIAGGEGVYGLAQALHRAGARSVMATLWPVSDQATAAFMQIFYTRLAAGDDPQKALRSAQLAFAEGRQWNDPVFWAPFVLTGKD